MRNTLFNLGIDTFLEVKGMRCAYFPQALIELTLGFETKYTERVLRTYK